MDRGRGQLVTKAGMRISLDYEFVSIGHKLREGHLLSDTREIDPGIFCERLRLDCENGSSFDIAVINLSDKGVSFVASEIEPDETVPTP